MDENQHDILMEQQTENFRRSVTSEIEKLEQSIRNHKLNLDHNEALLEFFKDVDVEDFAPVKPQYKYDLLRQKLSIERDSRLKSLSHNLDDLVFAINQDEEALKHNKIRLELLNDGVAYDDLEEAFQNALQG